MESSTAAYVMPTTMRGIPLASLMSSPVTRGFYVTRSEDDTSSSASTNDVTLFYTTIDSGVKQRTDTTLIPDVSTTNEIVTVAYDYRNISESNTSNDDTSDVISEKDVGAREEKFSTSGYSTMPSKDSGDAENLSDDQKIDVIAIPAVIYDDRNVSESDISNDNTNDVISEKDVGAREEKFSTSGYSTSPLKDSADAENPSDDQKVDVITILAGRTTFKSGESRNFGYNTTPLPRAASPKSPTRRRIGVVVKRYNEASTPLWTGKRVVPRKRNRTAVSPIRDAVRRTESGSIRATASALRSASGTPPSSTFTSAKRKLAATTPIPLTGFESTTSPDIVNIHNDGEFLESFWKVTGAKVEDPEIRIIVESAISTNSIITTPSMTRIVSTANNPTAVTSTTLDDLTTPTVRATTTESVITGAVTNVEGVDTTSTTVNYLTDFTDTNASAAAIAEVEITSATSHSATDFPTIANTNAIATDSVATSTEDEIETTIANSAATIPTIANKQTIETDPAITTVTPAPAGTGIEIISTTTSYLPDAQATETDPAIATITPASAGTGIEIISTTTSYFPDMQATETDPAITTVPAAANAGIEITSTTTNYPAFTNTQATETEPVITTAPVGIEAANAGIEITSATGNYSIFAIPATTSIPVDTTLPSTTVSPSAAGATHATEPATSRSDVTDADTATTNVMTTVPDAALTDSTVIATSGNADVPSTATSAITNTLTTASQSGTGFIISSTAPIANIDAASTGSTALADLTTEYSAKILDSNNDSEAAIITTIEAAEIPTMSETSSIFSSTIETSKSLSTDSGTSAATITFPIQADENTITPMIARTAWTLPIAEPVTDAATAALEQSTIQIATKSIIRTTTSAREPNSATANEVPAIPEARMTSEEVTSEDVQSQNQNQTASRRDTTDHRVGQKAPRRRVVNRTNNWLGRPAVQQTNHQYPRNRVTAYRGRPRRPPSYPSSSRVVAENRRRKVTQKRVRVNSEEFSSTGRSDENIAGVQNITEHVAHDRTENTSRRVKVLKRVRERVVEEEGTTASPVKETTAFPRSSISAESETLQAHENGNIARRRKVMKRVKPRSRENLEETSVDVDSTINTTSTEAEITYAITNYSATDSPTIANTNAMATDSAATPAASSTEDEIKTTITTPTISTTTNTRGAITVTNENLTGNYQSNLRANESLSEGGKTRKKMRVVLKSVRAKSEEINPTDEANADFGKNLQGNFASDSHTNLPDKGSGRRRMRVVLKSVRPTSERTNSTIEEASANSDSTDLLDNPSNNSSKNFPDEEKTRTRTRVVLKRVKPEEGKTRAGEIREEPDSTDESLQDTTSSNLGGDKDLPVEYAARRRMRIVLKSVKLKSEDKNSTTDKPTADPDSTDEGLQDAASRNLHGDKDLPVEYAARRRMRVVLKSVKPKSEDTNSATDKPTADPDSVGEDLQGNLPSDRRANEKLSDEEEAREGTEVAPVPEERDSMAEETNAVVYFVDKSPQVIVPYNFSSASHAGDWEEPRSKPEESKATVEAPGDAEPQATEASVLVEGDTDRPSLEVNPSTSGGIFSRKSDSGYFNRRRKPTQSTTVAPLINTLPHTVNIHRRVRPIDTTLTPRIDLVDAFEDTEPYIKLPAIENDQRADVSDQSIHAQEFAVTLTDPPSSSKDTGETTLRDAVRRKISTTIAPKVEPTTARTITSYGEDFRSRQRPKTKNRPTINATTRPRRPPVIDYDYYEDEVPLVIGRSALNTKLFLTSKGTVRCLDQGNFPHPYSCRKFISCARMVNGQVIGTEYTCPDRLSFDPVGGICNWSAGLGCKE